MCVSVYPQAEGTVTPSGEDAERGEGDAPAEGDNQREADLLAQLTPEQVRQIMDEVFEEMLGGLKASDLVIEPNTNVLGFLVCD